MFTLLRQCKYCSVLNQVVEWVHLIMYFPMKSFVFPGVNCLFFISLGFYTLITNCFRVPTGLTDPIDIYSVEAFPLWSSVLPYHTWASCSPVLLHGCHTLTFHHHFCLPSFWFIPSFQQDIFSHSFWRKGAWEVIFIEILYCYFAG